nr:MAG TPA: hypothetical protein [Caudoviricetes sp.]
MENAKVRAGDNLQDPKITKGMVDGVEPPRGEKSSCPTPAIDCNSGQEDTG